MPLVFLSVVLGVLSPRPAKPEPRVEPVVRSGWVSRDKSFSLEFSFSNEKTEATILGGCLKISAVGTAVPGGLNIVKIMKENLNCSPSQARERATESSQQEELFSETMRLNQLCLERRQGYLNAGCISKIRLYPEIPFPQKFVGKWKLENSSILINPDGVLVSSECYPNQTISLTTVTLDSHKPVGEISAVLTADDMTEITQLGCGAKSLAGSGRRSDWLIRSRGKTLRISIGRRVFNLRK